MSRVLIRHLFIPASYNANPKQEPTFLRHICNGVMLLIQMSHVTQVNTSSLHSRLMQCHSQTSTYIITSHMQMCHVTSVNESCHMGKRVTSRYRLMHSFGIYICNNIGACLLYLYDMVRDSFVYIIIFIGIVASYLVTAMSHPPPHAIVWRQYT